MTPGKPETPTLSNYPYDALPSTPQQPQYHVVLPSHSSGHRRQYRLCRFYLFSAITVLLLAAAGYVLWPSDPQLKVVNLSLDHLKVNADPISLDVELGVRIKVRNPDVYSLDYQSLNVSVEYRGEQLGFVTSDDGRVKAFGTSYINATLVLNGSEVISETVSLIQDMVKGSIPFTTTSEISGSLGILFFNLPITAKISCEVVMSPQNQTIERQDCYPAFHVGAPPRGLMGGAGCLFGSEWFRFRSCVSIKSMSEWEGKKKKGAVSHCSRLLTVATAPVALPTALVAAGTLRLHPSAPPEPFGIAALPNFNFAPGIGSKLLFSQLDNVIANEADNNITTPAV
ncbi:hypothetical protein R6Q57_028885 [Mikania cordata]